MGLLMAVCFTLATQLQPRALLLNKTDPGSDLLTTALGDGRRMFANHFFVKADVYFHSGYYPGFIQQSLSQGPAKQVHIAENHDHDGGKPDEDEAHEEGMNFLGKPHDWIDGFGRHFYSSTHSHLDKPGEAREILPWLKLAADLDPQKIETYTTACYWLRHNMKKSQEAEAFLRMGLKANPLSYELLFELGKIYNEDRNEPEHALNLFELALKRWKDAATENRKPDNLAGDSILAHLAGIEEKQGRLKESMGYLEQQVQISPTPDVIRQRIKELQDKLAVK